MNVVILGGLGNYGLTVAGLIMELGHNVTLLQFPGSVQRLSVQPQKNYEPIIREFEGKQGKFSFCCNNHESKKEYHYTGKVIRNVIDIPENIEVIIVAYPSLIHENIGRLLKGRLSGKTVITFTDRFLGGFSLLREAGALQTTQLISVGATPVTSFKDDKDPFQRIVYLDKKTSRQPSTLPTDQKA